MATLVGCQKYSEYKKTPQGGVLITPHGIKIKDLKIIRWKVGYKYRDEVSKGIKFHLLLPLIKKEYLHRLVKMGVDSWVIKISRNRIISTETLDYFTIPLLIPQKQIMGSSSFKPMRSGRVNIFYASSFINLDKSSSACPKLGHRKIITKLDIKHKKSLGKIFSCFLRQRISFEYKIPIYRL